MAGTVLHVIESYGGGVASAVDSYIDATPEHEHHALIRVRQGDFLNDGEMQRFASVTHMGRGLGAVRQVRSTTRRVSADVVHAHSSYAGVYVRVALSPSAKRRIVYTPHCFAFERQDFTSSSRAAFRAVERVLARRTTVLAGCSEREVELFKRMAPTGTAIFVPNVASVDARTLSLESSGAVLHVVGVGRVADQKDPRFFRDLIVAARRASPTPIRATWIGGGDQETVNDLASSGIEVTGWLPRSEAYRVLASATVYVHTAKWEGFPMSVLEAHTLGVPIVARATGPLESAPHRWAARDVDTLVHQVLSLAASNLRASNFQAWAEFLQPNTKARQSRALMAAYGTEQTVA